MYIPILSSTFPEPRPGPHATGYAVARVPVPAAEQYAGTPKLHDGTPALNLTESVMAIYYPTPPTTERIEGVPWTPEPLSGAMAGYATYGRRNLGSWASWVGEKVLGRLRVPVHPAAPLSESEGKFPLVIFSHGLVGTRNTYSHFCSSIASEGYVVVAVEHADGSNPCVIRDGKEKVFLRLGDTDLWENDGSDPVKAPEMMLWRAHQLDFRVREVYAAYECFKRFLSGEGEAGGAPTEALRSKVDLENLHLTGHSFGGATVLRVLQTSHPTPLPVKRAVLLDPWMEPFSRALPASPATQDPPPTQIIISGDWANNSFFPDEVKAARSLGASLCTIVGLSHQGFSDFGMMGVKAKGREYLQTVHTLTMARLRDQPYPFEGEPDGGEPERVQGRIAGELGAVLRHF